MPEEAIAPPPPPVPAKKGIFKPKEAPQPDVGGMMERINSLAARVRIGEERHSEIRKKLLVVEQNMLSNHKKAMNEIKSLQTDISEIKRTMQVIEDRIIMIIKELRLTARKEDVQVLKRYQELWDPVKFVSQEQVEKIIDEKLGKHEAHKPPRYDSP